MILLKSLKADRFKQLRKVDLSFPGRGSFLIEGLNESGKSSLFEAIFFGMFGRALIPVNLEDLIDYASDQAEVELSLIIRDRLFKVSRTLYRKKPNLATLQIINQDGTVEEIGRVTAVNKRLVEELGLDADALLNSCFVEQKKLDKLEISTAQEREEALMKLLNLDRLLSLEDNLKIRREDERALEELKKKYELAQIKAQVPLLEESKRKVERKLDLINLKKIFGQIEIEQREIHALNTQIATLKPKREQLEKRMKTIEEAKKGQDIIEKVQNNFIRIEDQNKEIAESEKRLKELEEIKAQMPEKLKRMREISLLRRQMERLEKLEDLEAETKRDLEKIEADLQRVRQLKDNLLAESDKLQTKQSQLNNLKIEESQLSQRVRLIHQREALENWRRAKHTLDALGVLKEKETELTQKREAAKTRRKESEAKLKREWQKGAASFFLSAIFLLFALARWRPAGSIVLIAISLLLLSFFALTISKIRRLTEEKASHVSELENLELESLILERQKETARDAGERQEGKLEDYESALLNLGLGIPESISECDSKLAEYQEKLKEVDPERTKAQYLQVEKELSSLESTLKGIEDKIDELNKDLTQYKEKQLQENRDQGRKRIEKCEKIIRKWKPVLETKASELRLLFDLPKVSAELVRINSELEHDKEQLNKRGHEEAKLQGYRRTVLKLQEENRQNHEALKNIFAKLPDWSDKMDKSYYDKLGQKVFDYLQRLNEENTKKELEKVRSSLDGANSARELRETNIQALRRQLSESLVNLGISIPEMEIAEPKITELEPEFAAIKVEDESLLSQERDNLIAQLGNLQISAERLYKEYPQFRGLELDVEECRKEAERKEREHKVREKAVEILKVARTNIKNKVLPNTERNMQQLLPILTKDRYRDAKITDEYKIEVWDERAQDYKTKNIFSGGTKDQFSLALRLSFALATLPEERGTAPAFIFLDEPLSSFDAQRAEALIELITRGYIAENFNQIFVITHSRTFSRELFNYYIVLDNGRIIEHNLDASGVS